MRFAFFNSVSLSAPERSPASNTARNASPAPTVSRTSTLKPSCSVHVSSRQRPAPAAPRVTQTTGHENFPESAEADSDHRSVVRTSSPVGAALHGSLLPHQLAAASHESRHGPRTEGGD